ncbi:uncharacterized protein KMC42_gp49 [Natrialba phage PhiCh1]|uniref:Uncharacterized protein n=1 Tax=Natrialba phage PhiCh1 TaxID=114777 RepID=A0A481W4P8_9CAUD|nr:uncharacterized protein KMC42_gp49 [Natrialba phage PhiCh1]QBJ01230.1 uncharacterized protein PhiCh1_240 [Natrialba phage PhiCh1]
MNTPNRHCHRSRSNGRHHLSVVGAMSDARGTVLVPEWHVSAYGLKSLYARLTKNQRRQEPEWLYTLLFLPHRDNVCASVRGVTVSRWGVVLSGRRRFAMSSRTNGSNNDTKRYETAG